MALQAIAKAPDIVDRDQMIGLAEHAEHRTIDRGDDLIERARVLGVDRPFARLGRAVPDQRRSNRARCRDHERKPAGLTDAHDREPRRIGLRDGRKASIAASSAMTASGSLTSQLASPRCSASWSGMLEVEVRRDGGKPSRANAPPGRACGGPGRSARGRRSRTGPWLRRPARRRRPACRRCRSSVRAPDAGHGFAASRRESLRRRSRSSGGAAARSPSATSASKLALMPSSNSAASRAITPLSDVEIVGGRCDLWRGLGVLGQDRDDLVAIGGLVDDTSSP